MGSPPLASPDAKGIRVILTSDQAGRLNMGAPVLFHGYRVGSVEASSFDIKSRNMHYQLFINAPYDGLVTENVRFWRDSGIALDLSAQGVRLEMGSLTTLFSGGVSFDVVEGWQPGKRVEDKSLFRLYEDQKVFRILYIRCIKILSCFSLTQFVDYNLERQSNSEEFV